MVDVVDRGAEKNVCAGIVLYNPEIERLNQNIAAIQNQVNQIIIVDNHSTNIDALKNAFNDRNIKWIVNQKNIGIAGALNQLLNQASYLHFDWLITLDQDSVVCDNLVDIQIDALSDIGNKNVAMIAPYMVDINMHTLEEYKQLDLPDYEFVEFCITSGTMTNVKAAKEVGLFNTKLFIDFVDHDMCLRFRKAGYSVIQVNRAYMLHEIGKIQVVYIFPKLGTLTGITWFKRPKSYPNHAPMRVYYQSRNLIYMLRKYGSFFKPHPFRYWLSFCRGMCVRFILEKNRREKLIMFIKGSFCGIFMKIF